MREKRGVLLTIMISSLLLGACGNQGAVPASVAELETVPLKQVQDRDENSGLPESNEEGAGADGTVDTVPEDDGMDGKTNMENRNGEDDNALKEAAEGGENIASSGVSGEYGESSADIVPDDGAQALPAEGQAQSGASGGNSGDTGSAEEPSAAEPQPEEVRITVSVAGDVTLGNYIGQGYEISFRQTYDKGVGDSYFFENVADIFSEDDLTLVNLEGPLTRSGDFREGQTYCISGDPEYANILTSGSVEAVSMANNHRLDYKEQGTADTVEALEEAGILYAYDNNYCMYETGGIQIGIVSVNEVGQGTGVEKYLQEGIEQLRGEGADLVFACCHWGIEREYYPEAYQESLGKKCIDWGYDLVIGHHPHVLQGIEEYEGKFILYSLGNFCFGANRNPPDKDTMIFQQTFTFRDGEKQEEQEIRVIPCSVSSVTSRNDYKPTPAEGEEAQRILDKINECSRDFGVELDSEGYLKETQ